MSGLEAIGVAASIIQVADLGTKLSVQLFSFYRRYKNANESIQLLSNEIALVSAILRELGDNLKGEDSSKLCSDEAFRTLHLVLAQCRDVLAQIQRVVDGNDQPGKSRFQQVTEKFRIVMLEPSLDQLKLNLERLKSTMLLLLNVIMYAGQIRSNNVPALVQEQRDLIQSLLNDRQVDNPKPRQLDEATESPRGLSTQTTQPRGNFAHSWSAEAPRQKQSLKDYLASKNQRPRASTGSTNSSGAQSPAQGATQDNKPPELREYNILIKNMLREIESCRSKLEKTRHSRIKDGVLNIHSGEMMRFTIEYGPSINIDHSLFAEHKSETVPKPEVTDAGSAGSTLPSSSAETPAIYVDYDASSSSETDVSIRRQRGRSSRRPPRAAKMSRRPPEVVERPIMLEQLFSRSYSSSSSDRQGIFEREPVVIINEPAQRRSNSYSPLPRPRRQSTFANDSDDPLGERHDMGTFKQSQEIERLERELEKSRVLEKRDSRQDMETFKQQQEIERLERELEKSRILEKRDMRQDMEIWKQQQEIERVERELEKQLLLEKSGLHPNMNIREQQRKLALLGRDLRRNRQRAAADSDVRDVRDVRESQLLRGRRVRDEDVLRARVRRLEEMDVHAGEYRPRLRRVKVPEEKRAARRYERGDTPGTVGRSSDQERESGDGLKASVVRRGGGDAQEERISEISLPDNLEDLLAQWTTLDQQEIQRGQIEAF